MNTTEDDEMSTKDEEVVNIKISIKGRVNIEVEGENLELVTNKSIKLLNKALQTEINKAKRTYRRNHRIAINKSDSVIESTNKVEDKPKLPDMPQSKEGDDDEVDLQELADNKPQGNITLESLGLKLKTT